MKYEYDIAIFENVTDDALRADLASRGEDGWAMAQSSITHRVERYTDGKPSKLFFSGAAVFSRAVAEPEPATEPLPDFTVPVEGPAPEAPVEPPALAEPVIEEAASAPVTEETTATA
jgi:hypothetical protein